MKEEKKDTLIELLSNEDFNKWILEPTYERDLFWNKSLENNPDKVHLVNAAKEFLRSVNYRRLNLNPEEKDEILSNIISQTSLRKEYPTTKIKQSRTRKLNWIYKVAAAIVIVGAGVFWQVTHQNSIDESTEPAIVKKENPHGRKSRILLPDSTVVILNSGSELTYDSDYGKNERNVKITGEAFFDVKHNPRKPFNVISNGVMTTALGTSFNVRAFDNEKTLKVSLKTGKVKIKHLSTAQNQEHTLDPGEGLLISKKSNAVQKVEIDPMIEFGWKDGILVFEDNTLKEVVMSLERWYGVQITATGKPDKLWKVNGQFKNETLEQVLNGLSFTYDVEFQITGKNVQLKF